MNKAGEVVARMIARRVVLYLVTGPILGELLAGTADAADIASAAVEVCC